MRAPTLRRFARFLEQAAGAVRPARRGTSPQSTLRGALACGALVALGCGSQDVHRNLDPVQVGLTKDVAPLIDEGETTLFEVKRGVALPIVRPSDAQRAALNKQNVEPYGTMPWITNDDVRVQLTWTLSNLDDEDHVVELLVDPWNEFARYYPGMALTDAADQKFEPNSSGIDHYYVVPGKLAGEASRRHGTFTFEDMNEMAIDFATVQAMRAHPPPLPNGVDSDPMMMTDPLPIYANHAFNVQNRSYHDLLIEPYIPKIIAGLTGIDFGFRTTEKATVALDVQIEIVDTQRDRVQAERESKPLLEPPPLVITFGTTVPAAM